MALTEEQRIEKIASKLFTELERVVALDDSVRDRVYTRVIEKLCARRMPITAMGIRELRKLSLDIL
jgi:hypothetical protein